MSKGIMLYIKLSQGLHKHSWDGPKKSPDSEQQLVHHTKCCFVWGFEPTRLSATTKPQPRKEILI